MERQVIISPTKNWNNDYLTHEPLVVVSHSLTGNGSELGSRVKGFSGHQAGGEIWIPYFFPTIRSHRLQRIAIISRDLPAREESWLAKEIFDEQNIQIEKLLEFKDKFSNPCKDIMYELSNLIKTGTHECATRYAEEFAVRYGFSTIRDNIFDETIITEKTKAYKLSQDKLKINPSEGWENSQYKCGY